MTPHFWLRKLGDWIVTPLLSPMEGLRKEDQIYREVSSDLDMLSLKYLWDIRVGMSLWNLRGLSAVNASLELCLLVVDKE